MPPLGQEALFGHRPGRTFGKTARMGEDITAEGGYGSLEFLPGLGYALDQDHNGRGKDRRSWAPPLPCSTKPITWRNVG